MRLRKKFQFEERKQANQKRVIIIKASQFCILKVLTLTFFFFFLGSI